MHSYPLIILGAGPCGLFAAFEAGLLGIPCAIVDAQSIVGGQCTALYPEKLIYDIPGLPAIPAADLVKNLMLQIAPFKVPIFLNERVVGIEQYTTCTSVVAENFDDLSDEDKGNEWQFLLKTQSSSVFRAQCILVATGGGMFQPNRPPIVNLEQFEGSSVFYSITNKERFSDKTVAIAGGGDSAVDWALELVNVARCVYFIHRRDKFRAANNSVGKLLQFAKDYPDKLKLIIPWQLHSVRGVESRIEAITVIHESGEKQDIAVDILLPFFGFSSDRSDIAQWQIEIEHNHIYVNSATMETSRSGIFAIGDICSYAGKLKLILSGFSEGAMAMHAIYKRLYNRALHLEYSTSRIPKITQ